jgi:hypothetical protein
VFVRFYRPETARPVWATGIGASTLPNADIIGFDTDPGITYRRGALPFQSPSSFQSSDESSSAPGIG